MEPFNITLKFIETKQNLSNLLLRWL